MHKVENLVVVVAGEPLAYSDIVARGMKTSHKNVISLLRKHLGVMEQFGTLAFETRKSAGRPTDVALLNERQAALLISLMRNSETVIAFKASLIAEFYRMRDALNQRDNNLWQQMQALIAKEVESKVRASFGSHLMTERKREIPFFREEMGRIESEIQPSLLPH